MRLPRYKTQIGAMFVVAIVSIGCRTLATAPPHSLGTTQNFPLMLSWQRSFESDIHEYPSAFLISDDVLVIVDHGSIWAGDSYVGLDTITGERLWERNFRGIARHGTIVNNQYVVADGGLGLLSLNVYTGETLWHLEQFPGQSTVSSLVVHDEVVYIAGRGIIGAYSLASGSEVWTKALQVGGLKLWVDKQADQLIAHGAESYYEVHLPQGWISDSIPIPVDQRIHCPYFVDQEEATPTGYSYCLGRVLDINNLNILTSWDIASNTFTHYWITSHSIAFVGNQGTLALGGVPSGDIIWQYKPLPLGDATGQVKLYSLTFFEGVLYGVASDGTIRAIDSQTGEEIGWWQGTVPPDSQNPHFIRSNSHGVYAYFGGDTVYAFASPSPVPVP